MIKYDILYNKINAEKYDPKKTFDFTKEKKLIAKATQNYKLV